MNTKSVLITGASTGIGEACAGFLDGRGFRVFAGVRKEADAEKLTRAASENLTPVFLDVVDRESIDRAHEVIQDVVGERGLDGLVNNAGIGVGGPLEFVPPEDLHRQFDVNVFGPVAVTQRFLPLLRTARGRIVNMSSIAGRWAAPILGPYAMSKFALEAYSDSLRRELHAWGIEVACVEPGAIATPIWGKALDSSKHRRATAPPEAIELYGKAIDAMRQQTEQASGRAIPAEAVARVVHRALTARKPKTRYLVGQDAKIQAQLVRFLPDRVLDAILRRFLRIDKA